jgi:hypothetical protein
MWQDVVFTATSKLTKFEIMNVPIFNNVSRHKNVHPDLDPVPYNVILGRRVESLKGT